jgi:hypothetical protein
MHQTSFGAAAWQSPVGCGANRLLWRLATISPFSSNTSPIVLAAGNCRPGRFSRSLIFLGPHDGCARRSARRTSTSSSGSCAGSSWGRETDPPDRSPELSEPLLVLLAGRSRDSVLATQIRKPFTLGQANHHFHTKIHGLLHLQGTGPPGQPYQLSPMCPVYSVTHVPGLHPPIARGVRVAARAAAGAA